MIKSILPYFNNTLLYSCLFLRTESKKQPGSIWLVAPLVSKLPSAVQGRVLKVASQVLEHGGWCKEQKGRRSGQENQSLLSHQPFLQLVLTCLKGQEEGQREGLLSSLHQQLSQVIIIIIVSKK